MEVSIWQYDQVDGIAHTFLSIVSVLKLTAKKMIESAPDRILSKVFPEKAVRLSLDLECGHRPTLNQNFRSNVAELSFH